MQKAYVRINWENDPSDATALNAANLNRMDAAIDEIDNRVIELDTTKLNVENANNLVKNITLDNETGVFTITKYNNSIVTLTTNLAKIPLTWSYDYNTQEILFTQSDGTVARISLKSLIQNNEFVDSEKIAFIISQEGIVSATIKAHSITDEDLRSDYLADIRVAMENAAASERSSASHDASAQSWAVGQTQTRPGEDTDNSKYYSQQSEASRVAAEQAKSDAQDLVNAAIARLTNMTVQVNLTDGCLYYDAPTGVILQVDSQTGCLMYNISAA